MDAVPARARVEYLTDGKLPTSDVIGGDTEALSHAGRRALSDLVQEPTLATFFEASRGFAREAGLLTDRVREVVTDVSEAGGEATMGMLGETVFALDTGLSDAGYDPEVCRIHEAGTTMLAPPGEPEPVE
jgi:pantoate kinase